MTQLQCGYGRVPPSIFLCWSNKVVYIHAVALRPQPLVRASIFPEQFKWTWNWKQMWAPACYCTRANGAQGGKGGGGGRNCMKGPSAAPGLSSLEGVWTPDSTSLHSENELLTENRWGWPGGGGRGHHMEGGLMGKVWWGRLERKQSYKPVECRFIHIPRVRK